jgi:hypothetical protein
LKGIQKNTLKKKEIKVVRDKMLVIPKKTLPLGSVF